MCESLLGVGAQSQGAPGTPHPAGKRVPNTSGIVTKSFHWLNYMEPYLRHPRGEDSAFEIKKIKELDRKTCIKYIRNRYEIFLKQKDKSKEGKKFPR